MSSTIPLPPREQLCNRYYSNKHTHKHQLYDQAGVTVEAGKWGVGNGVTPTLGYIHLQTHTRNEHTLANTHTQVNTLDASKNAVLTHLRRGKSCN